MMDLTYSPSNSPGQQLEACSGRVAVRNKEHKSALLSNWYPLLQKGSKIKSNELYK